MIRIREIDHLVLRVRDLGAMLGFYCTVELNGPPWAAGEGPRRGR